MYNTLLKNIYVAIAALFITMPALPTTAQAQGKNHSRSAQRVGRRQWLPDATRC
ncbi:hypothetical protein [Alloprevotella tannerae]|uniref:hypothetical protein n=1 Tax=Alloprevotella tannerae TaxID=76122 RepID=UPI00288B6F71|nr:hypothetical protein [Alloprevotella tannerae]